MAEADRELGGAVIYDPTNPAHVRERRDGCDRAVLALTLRGRFDRVQELAELSEQLTEQLEKLEREQAETPTGG